MLILASCDVNRGKASRTCRICDSYSPATETAEATVQNHLPNLPHLPLSNYFPLLNSSSIILKLTTLNTDYQLAKKLFCHRTIATKPNLCHSLTRITYLLNQNHPPASILLCPNTLYTLLNTHRLKPIYYSKTFLNYSPNQQITSYSLPAQNNLHYLLSLPG